MQRCLGSLHGWRVCRATIFLGWGLCHSRLEVPPWSASVSHLTNNPRCPAVGNDARVERLEH